MAWLDPAHPFFRPVWRRWATAGLPTVWGLIELATGNPGWAILFLGMGVYAAAVLLWKRPSG